MTRYHTVGYSTVYEYYAYGREVNKKRPRIAQMVCIKLGIELLHVLKRVNGNFRKISDEVS